MNIYLNNEEVSTNAKTLNDFLSDQYLIDKKGIAVAVNNEIISKSDWIKTALTSNDKILVITATQGG